MDAKAKYKLEDKALSRRAATLSNLDDASEQRREIGIIAAGLEEAVNQKNWGLVERMGALLIKLRESQATAKKASEEMISMDRFNELLGQVLNCVGGRIREALPETDTDDDDDDPPYLKVIDLIESDIRSLHFRLAPKQLEDRR